MTYLDTGALDGLKELLGDDLYEISDLYVTTLPEAVHGLLASHAQGDVQRLMQEAHALKGSSANMGAQEMARLCSGIEKMALDGSQREAVAALVAGLEPVAMATVSAMRSAGYARSPAA